MWAWFRCCWSGVGVCGCGVSVLSIAISTSVVVCVVGSGCIGACIYCASCEIVVGAVVTRGSAVDGCVGERWGAVGCGKEGRYEFI